MNATYAAAGHTMRLSIAMYREALDGLPDEAVAWRPLPGMNPIAVLLMHAITSTRYFLNNGAGQQGSLTRYREVERAGSFRTEGVAVTDLRAALDAFENELDGILSRGDEATLARLLTWQEDRSMDMTCAAALFRGVAHFREHLGHVHAVRDLWLARQEASASR